MLGQIIGNYKVISVLGEGGMGIVYKALDMKLERFVALKILSAQIAHSPQFVERFKREAKNQAKLNCPNIIPVYGFVEERGQLGIAMEFVDGETLEKLIMRKSSLEIGEAFEIAQQILKGVGYAHQKGFIHRDIKPSNIIIDKEGVVKIMDFGISKSIVEKGITKTGTKIGTLLYMSPEQINALDPTRASDIYSIGITLYEMIVGITPFEFNTEYEIMEGHLKKIPPKVSSNFDSLPSEVDKMISKSLEKEPLKRYNTCEDFLADVDLFLNKFNTKKKTEPENFNYVVDEKHSRKQKLKLLIFVVVVLSAIIGASYFFFNVISKSIYFTGKSKKISGDTTFSSRANPNYFGKISFQKLNTNSSNSYFGIDVLDGKIIMACGDSGKIIRSIDNGINWVDLEFPEKYKLNAISTKYSDNIFVVGERGKIFHSADGGEKWIEVISGTDKSLFSVFFLDRFTGYISGEKGVLLKSLDKGKTWTRSNIPFDKAVFSVSFIDDNTGYAVGWDGAILKTVDKGNNWELSKSFTDQFLKDIVFLDEKTGIICGGQGVIYRSEDGGKEWNLIKSEVSSDLNSIVFTDKSRGCIVSGKGEILKSEDYGKTWTVESNGGNAFSFTQVSSKSGTELFVSGLNGVVVKLKN